MLKNIRMKKSADINDHIADCSDEMVFKTGRVNKMKININNSKKLNAALATVNGNATARTMSVYDCNQVVTKIEKTLNDLLIPKKYWVGASATYSEQVYCTSYKYEYATTEIKIERFASGWFVVGLRRPNCYPSSSGNDYKIHLTEESKKIAVEKFFEKKLAFNGVTAVSKINYDEPHIVGF